MRKAQGILRAAVLVSTLLASSSAWAQNGTPNQSITVSPTTLIFGQMANFTLAGNSNGWTFASASWKYQWSVGACTGGMTAAGMNPQIPLQFVGTLKVYCVVSYNNGSGGRTTSASLDKTVTVPPPDSLRIVSGNNVSKQFQSLNPTLFQITCQGQDCIYFAGIYAQENISNARNMLTNKPITISSGWVPTPSVAGANLFVYSGNGQILDNKGLPNTTVFTNAPAGTALLSATQAIRITLYDPCGNPMAPIVLKTYNLTEKKDTQNQQGGTYIISHL